MQVYVLNHHQQPLMPCSPRKARLLLAAGQAQVVRTTPFTIEMLYGSSGYRQPVVAALDTGSKVVGSAAIANGVVLYQAEVTLRDDIASKMEQRRSYRRARRGRKTRYRQARFDNRSASTRKGRLPPSIQSKVDSHLREVHFMESILPVTRWKFELAAFDIHKITNPQVSGAGYQHGPQKDFYNVRQYVLARDGYRCRSGKKGPHSKKLHVHHEIYRSDRGSDAPENLRTLCETCHHDLHDGKFTLPVKRQRATTKHATEIGIVKARLAASGVAHEAVFGYETKYRREQLGWPKCHAFDAVAACLDDGEVVQPTDRMLLKVHAASGDYRQTMGVRSERRIPTGKMLGFRKFDKVAFDGRVGFVKGKRSNGYFSIADLDDNAIHASAKVGDLVRLSARGTTLVEDLSTAEFYKRRKVDGPKARKATMAAPSATFLPAANGEVSRSSAR